MATSLHDDLLSMYTTYLDERGYQALKIAETATKTPDLEVTGHGNVYLNEFKSPDLRLDPVMGMYKFATTNSKLWGSIHTALKQFTAYDPSHSAPWVITFASVNFQLCWNSLREAMQGGSVVEGRVMFDWTRSAEFKRWTKGPLGGGPLHLAPGEPAPAVSGVVRHQQAITASSARR
jgi:hypothetical protein